MATGRSRLPYFWIAGVSDGLDGLLARVLKQKTTLGLYLDPIADKLLMSTMFLVLMHVGKIPRYVTVLVFSRDLGILIIATLLFATHTLRQFPPSKLGKVNTVVQILGLADGDDVPGGERAAHLLVAAGRVVEGHRGAGAGECGGVCVDCDPAGTVAHCVARAGCDGWAIELH